MTLDDLIAGASDLPNGTTFKLKDLSPEAWEALENGEKISLGQAFSEWEQGQRGNPGKVIEYVRRDPQNHHIYRRL